MIKLVSLKKKNHLNLFLKKKKKKKNFFENFATMNLKILQL